MMMNKQLMELHIQTMYWVADNYGLQISDRIPAGYTEKLAELVARRCIQCALDADDPILAMEMADIFGIKE